MRSCQFPFASVVVYSNGVVNACKYSVVVLPGNVTLYWIRELSWVAWISSNVDRIVVKITSDGEPLSRNRIPGGFGGCRQRSER